MLPSQLVSFRQHEPVLPLSVIFGVKQMFIQWPLRVTAWIPRSGLGSLPWESKQAELIWRYCRDELKTAARPRVRLQGCVYLRLPRLTGATADRWVVLCFRTSCLTRRPTWLRSSSSIRTSLGITTLICKYFLLSDPPFVITSSRSQL